MRVTKHWVYTALHIGCRINTTALFPSSCYNASNAKYNLLLIRFLLILHGSISALAPVTSAHTVWVIGLITASDPFMHIHSWIPCTLIMEIIKPIISDKYRRESNCWLSESIRHWYFVWFHLVYPKIWKAGTHKLICILSQIFQVDDWKRMFFALQTVDDIEMSKMIKNRCFRGVSVLLRI